MVGVSVVTMFTVMAQSVKVSITDTLNGSFGGDLVLSTGQGGLPPAIEGQLGDVPEIGTATGLGDAAARINGKRHEFTTADPAAIDRVLDLKVTEGSVSGLRPDQIAVSTDHASAEGWKLGTSVPLAFADGQSTTVTVGAVYDQADIAGGMLMPRAAWAPHAVQDRYGVVLVKLADGVSLADGRAAAERVTKPIAGLEVKDREQFVGEVGDEINQMLMLIYVMLALAILIALMGIANTLSLSLHERVRELGLLRAVGQTRRQVRAMVRGESVIIALFGTLLGLGLGVFLGWALVQAAASEGIGTFSASPVQLLAVAAIGGLAGILAARRPARRASRLNVLAAIATD
jgi:putative ABC transport system permease protein